MARGRDQGACPGPDLRLGGVAWGPTSALGRGLERKSARGAKVNLRPSGPNSRGSRRFLQEPGFVNRSTAGRKASSSSFSRTGEGRVLFSGAAREVLFFSHAGRKPLFSLGTCPARGTSIPGLPCGWCPGPDWTLPWPVPSSTGRWSARTTPH